MVGSKIGQPYSNKAQCSSREVSTDGYRQARVIIIEENIARFLGPGAVGHRLRQGKAPHCLWLPHGCFVGYLQEIGK